MYEAILQLVGERKTNKIFKEEYAKINKKIRGKCIVAFVERAVQQRWLTWLKIGLSPNRG